MIETIPVIPRRIVAEVNKMWPQTEGTPVSQMFEKVIIENRQKGFALEDWQLSRVTSDTGCISETIIAVFVEQPAAGG